MGNLGQRLRIDAVAPDLRNPGAVARVLLKQEAAMTIDGDVVEHAPARSCQLLSGQQNLDGSAQKRKIDVAELDSPQPAVGIHGRAWAARDRAGRYEIESIGMTRARIPGAVFGPQKTEYI